MIELDKIFNEDCLEGMKRIPDGSVDAVICDLPYGVLNKNNPDAQWDNIIPFNSLWEQYRRITKPTAAILLFGQGMFTADLMQSNRAMWKYNLIWQKDRVSGFLNSSKMPLRSHEDITVFYREQPAYNPQLTKGVPSHTRGKGNHQYTNRCYGDIKRIDTCNERDLSMKFPRSIIYTAKEHDRNTFHPTQKPVDLLRYLVLTYTNEGDTVLDNCMGSGTTAIACIREKRHFIGFELDKEYYERALKRIENEKRYLKLF